MPKRYLESEERVGIRFGLPRVGAALREKFREGYSLTDLKSDFMSGIIVGMVAIPLAMALAIASGVSPQYGLYTVILGGAIVALLGGSRFQVSGPTAAFVVILFPIVQKFGFSGLLMAGFMAGMILFAMGLARLGQLIQFIPHPVTTGFTAGIALVIATIQLKDFFGLQIEHMPENYLGRVYTLFEARVTWSFLETAVAATTLGSLILWPKLSKKIPAPLAVLTLITVGCILLKKIFPEFDVSTIGSRFSYDLNGVQGQGIPQALPGFNWPWNFSDQGRDFTLTLDNVKALVPSAFAIAMLGAIESLLSAVVADGMGKTKHDPNAELCALGVGNMICPFFGGIAATGAIARTAANIRFGAKSPFSAVIHAIFTLGVVFFFAPYVSYLPMAALAALLMLVAYNMSELKHFKHILQVAPKMDVIILVLCFSLTVIFDMVIGVSMGIVLAALLFMKRMSETTFAQVIEISKHPDYRSKFESISSKILIYEIAGPLFFGAAERAVQALHDIQNGTQIVIFEMDEVPAMDITGLVAFESAIARLKSMQLKIYLVGVRTQPMAVLKKSETFRSDGQIKIFRTREEATSEAQQYLEKAGPKVGSDRP